MCPPSPNILGTQKNCFVSIFYHLYQVLPSTVRGNPEKTQFGLKESVLNFAIIFYFFTCVDNNIVCELWPTSLTWVCVFICLCWYFFQQAHFQCCGSWPRRRGNRSCTPLSFRVFSTAASEWWSELWLKTARSSSITVAETLTTKRGEQEGGKWEHEFGQSIVSEFIYNSIFISILLNLPAFVHAFKQAWCMPTESLQFQWHCDTVGALLFFQILVFIVMSHSQRV